jgi:hypothetical protein
MKLDKIDNEKWAETQCRTETLQRHLTSRDCSSIRQIETNSDGCKAGELPSPTDLHPLGLLSMFAGYIRPVQLLNGKWLKALCGLG